VQGYISGSMAIHFPPFSLINEGHGSVLILVKYMCFVINIVSVAVNVCLLL
jgi:hypothetical protein